MAQSVQQNQLDYFRQKNIFEFPIFGIARQGGRTAAEILTRAVIMEGRYAYLGQNLSGLRSMGVNSIVFRCADTDDIPPGVEVTYPAGAMFMHEILLAAGRQTGFMSQLTPGDVIHRLEGGILMVCTDRAPDQIPYPVPFFGTVATVNAEKIFLEKVGIQPAPSGITALGLFAAATGDLVSLDALKEAALAHERLKKEIREANVICMEEAYNQAKVIRDLALPGLPPKKQSDGAALGTPVGNGSIGDPTRIAQFSMSAMWRTKLPVCETGKCTCGECLSAYCCPEAAISWNGDEMQFDYNFCKSCGTCITECVFNAITMVPAHEAGKTGGRMRGKK